jgi:hypothetical protein
MALDQMAAIAFPGGIPSSGHFYIFRERWNPSGTRFITFIKDPENKLFTVAAARSLARAERRAAAQAFAWNSQATLLS